MMITILSVIDNFIHSFYEHSEFCFTFSDVLGTITIMVSSFNIRINNTFMIRVSGPK